MRYNLDSTLPINAFSPRGGRRGSFSMGMTLEGGGGGVLSSVGDAFGSIVKPIARGVTDVVKGVVQPVYNATLRNIPGVDNALVNLDKSVGKAIPGGWGTVASVASSFIPGMNVAMKVGIGALNGSGALRGNNDFNLQGAILGGAMAYGASQLSQGLENAGKVGAEAGAKTSSDLIADAAKDAYDAMPKGYEAGPNGSIVELPPEVPSGIPPVPSPPSTAYQTPPFDPNYDPNAGLRQPIGESLARGEIGDALKTAGQDVSGGLKSLGESAGKIFDPATYSGTGTKLAEAGSGTLENTGNAASGIKNLVGLGDPTIASAYEAFKAPITQGGVAAGLVGFSGMASLEAQQKELDDQLANGTIGQAEYDTAKARIDAEVATARATVNANPLQASVDTSNVSEGPSLYSKKSIGSNTLYDKNPYGATTLYENTPIGAAGGGIINHYAMGGNVLMNPPDDQTGMPTQSPMQNFDQPGLMSMIGNTVPQQTYATGGIAEPRFLSGGGDGMSDSIHASIDGNQEARLADGEFVVPADVVSHIGNGSSKAGAKQLYSMMDRVRQARVGTKMQGKQINPRKYLAA